MPHQPRRTVHHSRQLPRAPAPPTRSANEHGRRRWGGGYACYRQGAPVVGHWLRQQRPRPTRRCPAPLPHAHLQSKLNVGRGKQRRHVRAAQQHHRLRAPPAAAAAARLSSASTAAAAGHQRKEQQHGGAHLGAPREAACASVRARWGGSTPVACTPIARTRSVLHRIPLLLLLLLLLLAGVVLAVGNIRAPLLPALAASAAAGRGARTAAVCAACLACCCCCCCGCLVLGVQVEGEALQRLEALRPAAGSCTHVHGPLVHLGGGEGAVVDIPRTVPPLPRSRNQSTTHPWMLPTLPARA